MSLLEDLELVWQTLGDELHAEHPAHDACVRIRATLETLPHLEEGARLLASFTKAHDGPDSRYHHWMADYEDWLAAEAKRKDDPR